MPPPPPPPPPPLCLPFFGGNKSRRRLTYSERSATEDYSSRRSSIDRLGTDSYSPTATLTSRAEKLTFSSETESYNVPNLDVAHEVTPRPTLKRSNTVAGTSSKDKSAGKKWGYGWGIGKKDKSKGMDEKDMMAAQHDTPPPRYNSPGSEMRSRATSGSKHSRSSHSMSQADYGGQSNADGSLNRHPSISTNGGSIRFVPPPAPPKGPKRSDTYKSNTTKASGRSARPTLYPSESSSTLVGSALERKIRDEDPIMARQDTSSRLEALRDLMRQHGLDF